MNILHKIDRWILCLLLIGNIVYAQNQNSESFTPRYGSIKIDDNRTETEGKNSTGLGLIICKEFIEKHAGGIWIESKEGKGSTFYFNFPKKQGN